MYRYLYIHLHLCLSDADACESTAWKFTKTKLFRNKRTRSFSPIIRFARSARRAYLLPAFGHLRSSRLSKNQAIPLVFHANTRNATCLVGFRVDLPIRCARNRKSVNGTTSATVRPLFLGSNLGIYVAHNVWGFISN